MPRPDKVTDVAELTEHFRSSNAAVLTEYRGLTVAQLTQLRSNLGSTAHYAVVKNTLSKIAVRDAGLQELESLLQGPSAIAFIKGDTVEAAKSLRDFAKANPLLVIKGGVLDGKMVTAAELSKIADLESREVLLAKVAGAANAALPRRPRCSRLRSRRPPVWSRPCVRRSPRTTPAAAASPDADTRHLSLPKHRPQCRRRHRLRGRRSSRAGRRSRRTGSRSRCRPDRSRRTRSRSRPESEPTAPDAE